MLVWSFSDGYANVLLKLISGNPKCIYFEDGITCANQQTLAQPGCEKLVTQTLVHNCLATKQKFNEFIIPGHHNCSETNVDSKWIRLELIHQSQHGFDWIFGVFEFQTAANDRPCSGWRYYLQITIIIVISIAPECQHAYDQRHQDLEPHFSK